MTSWSRPSHLRRRRVRQGFPGRQEVHLRGEKSCESRQGLKESFEEPLPSNRQLVEHGEEIRRHRVQGAQQVEVPPPLWGIRSMVAVIALILAQCKLFSTSVANRYCRRIECPRVRGDRDRCGGWQHRAARHQLSVRGASFLSRNLFTSYFTTPYS